MCFLGLVGGLFLFLRLCLYVFICCLFAMFAMNKKFYVTPRLVLSALVSGSLLTGSNEVSGVGGNTGIGYGGAGSGGARTRGRSWVEDSCLCALYICKLKKHPREAWSCEGCFWG